MAKAATIGREAGRGNRISRGMCLRRKLAQMGLLPWGRLLACQRRLGTGRKTWRLNPCPSAFGRFRKARTSASVLRRDKLRTPETSTMAVAAFARTRVSQPEEVPRSGERGYGPRPTRSGRDGVSPRIFDFCSYLRKRGPAGRQAHGGRHQLSPRPGECQCPPGSERETLVPTLRVGMPCRRSASRIYKIRGLGSARRNL